MVLYVLNEIKHIISYFIVIFGYRKCFQSHCERFLRKAKMKNRRKLLTRSSDPIKNNIKSFELSYRLNEWSILKT